MNALQAQSYPKDLNVVKIIHKGMQLPVSWNPEKEILSFIHGGELCLHIKFSYVETIHHGIGPLLKIWGWRMKNGPYASIDAVQEFLNEFLGHEPAEQNRLEK